MVYHLLVYTIKQAIDADIIDDIIVSTDDNNIKKIALKYGARVPFTRPNKLSTDKATNIDVALHAVEKVKCDILIILQPTSPLRKTSDITSSLKLLLNKDVKAVIGVNKNKSYVYSFETNNSNLILNSKNLSKIAQTGKIIKIFSQLMALFMLHITKFFNQKKTFFTSNTCIYEMPIHRSVDIDEMNDWKLVEKYSLINSMKILFSSSDPGSAQQNESISRQLKIENNNNIALISTPVLASKYYLSIFERKLF